MESLVNYMEITYKDIPNINFPVFAIKDVESLFFKDGLVYYSDRLIDDLNQPSNYLGVRRLTTPHKPIYPLRLMYRDIKELLGSGKKSYIDRYGFVFSYRKTKFCNVKFHKILKVKRKDTYSLLKISNYQTPIKILRPPPAGKSWVGMLYLNKHPWIPYEYSEAYCASKKRKI